MSLKRFKRTVLKHTQFRKKYQTFSWKMLPMVKSNLFGVNSTFYYDIKELVQHIFTCIW